MTIQRIFPKPLGEFPYPCILVFMKTPRLPILGKDELIAVECHNLCANVVERLETKGLFNGDGVRLLFLF